VAPAASTVTPAMLGAVLSPGTVVPRSRAPQAAVAFAVRARGGGAYVHVHKSSGAREAEREALRSARARLERELNRGAIAVSRSTTVACDQSDQPCTNVTLARVAGVAATPASQSPPAVLGEVGVDVAIEQGFGRRISNLPKIRLDSAAVDTLA